MIYNISVREKNTIDLALRQWSSSVVSWIALVLGLGGIIAGLGSLFFFFPQKSLVVGIIEIITGILLITGAILNFFSSRPYRPIFSRFILISWFFVLFWNFIILQNSSFYPLLISVVAFSALAFLLVGLVEGLVWHGILFLTEGVLLITLENFKLPVGIILFQFVTFLIFTAYASFLLSARNLLIQRLYFNPTTQLTNRNYLIDLIQQKAFAWLLILNIQNFKEFNDFFGYRMGDRILVEIASRLKKLEKKYNNIVICHLHGDEFAIAGREPWGHNLLENLCEELFILIGERPLAFPSLPPIKLSFHIGVSDVSDNLLSTADMAFRCAVSQGKRWAFYNNTMSVAKSYENHIQATILLQDAIQNDRIIPFFQPIVNLETGRIEKYECLARIADRNGKIYEPSFFLFIAQRNQLYTAITQTMIKKCFEIFSQIDTDFSINLSYQDLTDAKTTNTIFLHLSQYPNVAVRCIFEIVEEMAIQDFSVVENFIHKVKQFGVRVALDDFGSGYSNFEYLVKLPFDYIKIDGTLIERLPEDPRYQAVVENIVNFSHKIGSQTVAEFVSSEEIHQHIKQTRITYGQGYYYGKPGTHLISPKDRHFS